MDRREAAEQFDRVRIDPDLLGRFAKCRGFERFALVDTTARQRYLPV
jgi:hypothetical protein